jgi:hypothetical protein
MLARRPGTSNSPQYYLRPTGGGPICIDSLADSSRLAHGTSELMRNLQSPDGTRSLISSRLQEPASHAGRSILRPSLAMHDAFASRRA